MGRTFIAGLLIIILGAPPLAIAQETVAQNVGDDATKITVAEEHEVLEIAERFVRRMQETNDLIPLIGEMFVSDYAERLHREAINKSLFWIEKSVAKQASREELIRYSLALNNCVYLGGLLVAWTSAAYRPGPAPPPTCRSGSRRRQCATRWRSAGR